MLEETKEIYDCFFDDNEKKEIKNIIKELENPNYCSDKLWEFDKEIGGIGGYCLPIDPSVCWFQGTEVRNIYRSYQYARTRVDICDISFCSRDMIRDCGLGLEALLKLVCKKEKPLGVLISQIEKKKFMSLELISKLKLFLNNYNISKHEINITEERSRTFIIEDAIIYYLACRKIGLEILKLFNTELCNLSKYKFDIIYKTENYKEDRVIKKDGQILIIKKSHIYFEGI